MSKRRDGEVAAFPVVCTWCGGVIRHSDAKASHRMCLKCFARMMSEHNRTHQPADKPHRASDR